MPLTAADQRQLRAAEGSAHSYYQFEDEESGRMAGVGLFTPPVLRPQIIKELRSRFDTGD